MEAVGSEPIYAGSRPSRDPRDSAVERALLEAVSRVASEFLLDQLLEEPGESPGADPSNPSDPLAAGPGPTPPLIGPPPDYAKIFGRNLVQYTAHYRILEDRGERPALFAPDPTVESEYVVIVEVHVDALRVKRRLEEMGLVAPPPEALATRQIVLEVRGLQVYPAYEAVKAILLEEIGASQVVPLEFTRDSVRLGVDYGRGGPSELLEDLYARSPRELEITPVLSDEQQLTISVRWTPPDAMGAEDAEGPFPEE